jgi:hypothetical protein
VVLGGGGRGAGADQAIAEGQAGAGPLQHAGVVGVWARRVPSGSLR